MSGKKYGFGIIGCGMIANFHVKAFEAMSNATLLCAFDMNKDKAVAFGEKYGIKGTGDMDEFFETEGLDVVTICTPSGAHLEPALAAAKAGKHVVCEKPLEINIERVDEMIKTCDENGVTLSGLLPRRYNAAVKLFKKAVDEGRFGRVTLADAYIKWYRTQEYYDSGAWRGTWKLDGGGALMNQSIHTIDLLIHLVGSDVESVCAFADRAAHENIEVEDVATAILKFKNGTLGVIEGSTTSYSKTGHPAEVHITGNEGSVFLKDDKFTVWDFKNDSPEDAEVLKEHGHNPDAIGIGAADPTAIDFGGHQRNFEDILASLDAGKSPEIDGREARKCIEVITAIYKSAQAGGEKVTLPLEATPDFKSFR